MRLIDADAISFDALSNVFDKARAEIIIKSQPTIDTITEEKCREIANEIIPKVVVNSKVEAYKEVWGKLRSMCDAPHYCVWLSEIDMFFEKILEGENNDEY